ncbi:hypothetical protein BDL97_13G074400 [Sphagnum fallax]|nr:hypothetical protein BDL97_13G074400 [Sphagnum fallax]
MEPLYDSTSKYLRHLSYVTQQKNQIQAPINTPSLPSFSNPIRPYLVSTASSSSSFSSSSPAHFSTDSTRVCGHQTALPSLQSRQKPTPALYDPGFRRNASLFVCTRIATCLRSQEFDGVELILLLKNIKDFTFLVYEQLASNQRCMLHLICIPNSTGVGVKELPFNTTQRFTITLGQIQVQIWIWLDHVSVPFQEMSKESLCFLLLPSSPIKF